MLKLSYEMKLLLVTQYFYPENFKSNDIAFELVKRGHHVDVLCGIPNYPEGKYFHGYGLFRKRVETVEGVRIFRVFQTPRGKKAKGMMLALNYLTYAFFSCFWALCLALRNRYDCVLVHEPSPITQALPAVLLKRLRKVPFYIWVLDIWPDAMSSGGGIKNERILSVMTRFVQCVYNYATKILISSRDFETLVLKQGDYKDKIVYFPNWADDLLAMPIEPIPELPTGFRIIMGGNIGSAQTIEAVMQAAELTRDSADVKWIFVGDGSKRAYVEKFRETHHLEETVLTLGRYPCEYMPAFFREADAMLITLRADFPHLKAVVPARLQSYMSAGKPILGMIDGGSANLIEEAKCGYVAPAEDYNTLVQIIIERVLPHKEEFAKMGDNGRRYYEKYFTKDLCIENLISIIENG